MDMGRSCSGSSSLRQIKQTLSTKINGRILNCFSGTSVSLTKFRKSGVGFSLSMDERMVVLTILIDLLLQMESCIAETASVGLRFTRRGGLSV